ncbi:hypothetical protein ACHRVK_18410 [Flavobacterium plurextorum]|uniref:hypothetical protein n=1 Tax=Flavobacterium plurextorum TaxID=1114867 RepID=UPI003756E87C
MKRDLSDERILIGLVYPENFTIHENKVQTARANKIGESIYLINKQLKAKKRTKDNFYLLSLEVTSTGQITINFLEDLKRLAYYM